MSAPNHDGPVEAVSSPTAGPAAPPRTAKDPPEPTAAQTRSAAATSNLAGYEAAIDDKYLTDDIVYAIGK